MQSAPASDPRTTRALDLLAQSGQWARCTSLADGAELVAIPSQRVAGRFYLVDGTRCSCPDHTRRGVVCKHLRAYRAAQAPAPVATAGAEYDRIFGAD